MRKKDTLHLIKAGKELGDLRAVRGHADDGIASDLIGTEEDLDALFDVVGTDLLRNGVVDAGLGDNVDDAAADALAKGKLSRSGTCADTLAGNEVDQVMDMNDITRSEDTVN